MLTLDRGSQLAPTLVAAVTTLVAVVATVAIVSQLATSTDLPNLVIPFALPNLAVRSWVFRRLRRLRRSHRAHLEHAVVVTAYISRTPRTLLVEYSRLTNVEAILHADRLETIHLDWIHAFEQTRYAIDGPVPAIIWNPSVVISSHRLPSPPPSPLRIPQTITFNFEPAAEPEPLFPPPASITPATHPEYFPPEF